MKVKISDSSESNYEIPPKVTSSPCDKCFQPRTGRGIPHKCTPARRKAHLAELVIKEGGIASQQVAAELLKNVEREKGDKFQIKQLKGGNNLTVGLGKQKKVHGIVDGLLVAKLKKGLDLSNRETSKALRILRSGKVKVEQNVMDIMEEIGSSLDDEYENVKMEMEVNLESDDENDEKLENTKKKKKKSCLVMKEMNVAIAKDSKRLVEKVVEARGLNIEKVKCRGVLDTGQRVKCEMLAMV